MSIKLDQTIDYSAKDLESSSLSHMKLVPLSGNQTQAVGTAGVDITFEIPVQAVNLARSYFSASVSIPAQGGVTVSWAHRGIVPFSSMQLFTRGGQYLLNLQERATDYSRVVMSSDCSGDELEHGSEEGQLYPTTDTKSLIGDLGAVGSVAAPYKEQAYLSASGANAVQTYKIIFPMSQLKETILAVDKSILFREVIVCKFKLAPKGDIAYQGGLATSPDNVPVDLAGDITYSDIAFFVAQERNASIVQALNAQTESQEGFSLLVPYPSTFTNIRTTAQQNVSLRLNRSHGASLKAVKHVVFNNTGANLLRNDRYERNNRGQLKAATYYINLNNNRLTEFNIDSAKGEDWMVLRQKLRQSPSYNRAIYQLNWFHEDDFSNYADKMSDMKTKDTNCMSGISLNEEIRWDYYSTCANASHRHFTIAHGQKVLNINRSGLVIG